VSSPEQAVDLALRLAGTAVDEKAH